MRLFLQETSTEQTQNIRIDGSFMDFIDDNVGNGPESLLIVGHNSNEISRRDKPGTCLRRFILANAMAHAQCYLIA